MKKMGGMMSMLEKLPGAKNLPDHVKNQVDDKMFNKLEAIINSMTLKERANPDIIKGCRRRHIPGRRPMASYPKFRSRK